MIYDCFTFYNEVELLNLRFHELDPFVDFFVVVEAEQTFTGLKKPLIFKEKAKFFKQWEKKIIYINHGNLVGSNGWEREFYQRNATLPFLTKVMTRDDLLMLSDVDEIPDTSMLNEAFALARQNKSIIFSQNRCCYHLNRRFGMQDCMRIIRFGELLDRGTGMQIFRNSCPDLTGHGGWHFTNMGGAERISEKIQAFAHEEFNHPEYHSIDKIKKRVDAAGDLYDRQLLTNKDAAYLSQYNQVVMGIEQMPEYVRNNTSLFANWLF